jgi:hypothetical protein
MTKLRLVALLRVVAVLTLCAWIAIAIVRDMRAPALLICSILLMILLIVCWLGSVWLWSQSAARSLYHKAALPLLLAFGFVWGWAYILAAAGSFYEEEHMR